MTEPDQGQIPALDIVVIPKRELTTGLFAAIQTEFHAAIRKLRAR